jgi:hypothetical protein
MLGDAAGEGVSTEDGTAIGGGVVGRIVDENLLNRPIFAADAVGIPPKELSFALDMSSETAVGVKSNSLRHILFLRSAFSICNLTIS